MKIYSINYDLNKQGKDYAGLIKAIQTFPDYIHCMKSSWLVASAGSAVDVYNKISPHIDKDDFALVSRFTYDYYGWQRPDVWTWIQKYTSTLIAA